MYKDLGLFTASNLSWNQHVDKITAKANRVLGLVKRTCRDLKDIDIMKTLYCSLETFIRILMRNLEPSD